MDWDNARIFLAIYRVGTLRGAAEHLEIDQATAGRRLAALESSLGARLFLRTPSGYVPTPAGELAAAAATQMEQGAEQLQRQMQGMDERLCGVVRLAATDITARHFLLPALHRLHQEHPKIRVVLSTSTQLTNLTKREADIAVRTVRPDAPDLIARHLKRLHTGMYASKAYVKKRGLPDPGTGLKGHDVVIYPRSVSPSKSEQICGESIAHANVAMEVSTGLVMVDSLQAGFGIGELPTHVGDKASGLVRIWPQRAVPYDMWLVLHSDLNRTARVRAVADAIIAAYEAHKTHEAHEAHEANAPAEV